MKDKKIKKEVGVSVEKYVDDFFKRYGLGFTLKPEFFWRTLSKKFGTIADVFVDCAEAGERRGEVNHYPLKNRSVEFANAIASQFDAAKLKAVAIWFINDQPDIAGIVDPNYQTIIYDNKIPA